MLTISVGARSLSAGRFDWSGRRHDEDGVGPAQGSTPEEMFEAIYRTVASGEQVALGIQRPLTIAVPPDHPADSDHRADSDSGPSLDSGSGLEQLAWVLDQMGTWRPWTTATTALATWKATTSILLFEARSEPDLAVPALFQRVRTPDEARMGGNAGSVINRAAEAALRGRLVIDPGEVSQPALVVD